MDVKLIQTCPHCGSNDVSKPQYSRRMMAISFLLLGFPIPWMSKTIHCFECGEDFKAGKKDTT